MKVSIIRLIRGLICVILLRFFSFVGLVCGLFFCSGCLEDFSSDIEKAAMMEMPSSVSVSPKREIAFYKDKDIYITDFSGTRFTKMVGDKYYKNSVSWSKNGLLYVEEQDDMYTLNIYKYGEEINVLLQEMDFIFSPIMYDLLSYVVLPKESFIGNINIYEIDTSRTYTLVENAYYDYKWLPDKKKIIAISATNVYEDTFQGTLLIKDIDTLLEEIIFNGTFTISVDYVDITRDNNIIFSSGGEIYLYNIEKKELSKWQGPSGYDFRLAFSINSSLKGYVLAKVKGIEEGWGGEGQLYLINQDGQLIPIPGWPIWIDEPMVICMESSDIIVKNIENNEVVNITKKFEESKKSR